MKIKILLILAFILTATVYRVSAKTSAVIEDWKTSLILSSHHSLLIKEFIRIQVLDEDGYSNAVYRNYYNTFRKIRSLQYSIYDSSNKRVKKLSKSDALDIMINSSYEIDDVRLIVLDPKYRNFPFTIEIEVEVAYNNGFLDFPDWIPRYTHNLEVKQATLSLESHEGFEFMSRELNGVLKPEVVINENGRKSVKWSVRDLPAMDEHNGHRSFMAGQPKVHITPVNFEYGKITGNYKTWAAFGDWYIQLNEGRNSLSIQTQQYLNDLKKQHDGNTANLAKAVYKFVQSKTRYISIQLGIGGFQTIPSDEVEKTGYGDCKALTNYMKAMLDYLRIPSHHILINAGRDAADILPDFPSNQFNHVFLAVPTVADTLWFECTSQTSPPAYVGTFTDDRFALWIDKGNSRIIRTPAYSSTQSVRYNHCVADLQEKGDAHLTIRTNQTGLYYDEILAYQHLPKDKIEHLNYNKYSYKNFVIQSFDFDTPDQNKPELKLNYRIDVSGLGKLVGTKLIFPFNFVAPLEKELEVDLQNKKGEIRRAFTLEDEVEIKLPDNYRVDTMPDLLDEVSAFGSIKMTIRYDGNNKLYLHRKAVMQKGNFENEDFERFRDWLKKVRSYEQGKIIAQSKT